MSSVSCRSSSIESPLSTVAEIRFRSLLGFLSCCPRTSGAASATKTNAQCAREARFAEHLSASKLQPRRARSRTQTVSIALSSTCSSRTLAKAVRWR
jgi:hypothetical protein